MDREQDGEVIAARAAMVGKVVAWARSGNRIVFRATDGQRACPTCGKDDKTVRSGIELMGGVFPSRQIQLGGCLPCVRAMLPALRDQLYEIGADVPIPLRQFSTLSGAHDERNP